jgi:Mg2+-importing ATPase
MGSSSNFGNMFSMAGAALFLPFLPMLQIQILLNNLLYDVSEIAIPFDRVDEEAIAGPVKWDVKFIERFMLVFRPVSSVFDFLTFYVLLYLFGAGETLFQTGWFIESITTQVWWSSPSGRDDPSFKAGRTCSSPPWRLELSLSQSLFRCSP